MHVEYPEAGQCDCGDIVYHMLCSPLFVHCCHCRWCQRESGASFALNAMIESSNVVVQQGEVEIIPTPSESGYDQQIARCPTCKIALWSHYSGMGPFIAFVRIGTLQSPAAFPPDIHIFTASKQPSVTLGSDIPAVEAFYDCKQYWPQESLLRRERLLPQIAAYKSSLQSKRE